MEWKQERAPATIGTRTVDGVCFCWLVLRRGVCSIKRRSLNDVYNNYLSRYRRVVYYHMAQLQPGTIS